MRQLILLLAATGLFLALPPGFAALEAQEAAQFELEVAFPLLAFTRPVDLQHAGDRSDRIFVVEQRGVISVFPNDPGATTATAFLDIQARVDDAGNEEGLLGLAFHPDYQNNGFFYVNYTASDPSRTVISRFEVSAADSNVADPNSELDLLAIDQPFNNHNGGQIAFGPNDGYLYIATGDGGSGGDPLGHGQNLGTLLGAMLRIDVDNTEGGLNYAIPPSNPFAGNTDGYREEIYAYGLRNPWRFSFDRVTGRLWLADVGQESSEEIDIVDIGGNYGWNVMEGSHCFNPPTDCDMTGLEMPIWEYDHSIGHAVTGGYAYRGPSVPELSGKYVYADYVSGRIWSLEYDGVNPPLNVELLESSLNVASFGTDQNSELYICAFDGKIYRFTPTLPPVSVTITPIDSPIVIPSGGGSFDYTITIASNSASTETFELWTRLVGPENLERNPLFLRNVTLNPSQTITRTRTQRIPGRAPAGSYTYYLEAGTSHPNADLDSDSLSFDKSAAASADFIAHFPDQPHWSVVIRSE